MWLDLARTANYTSLSVRTLRRYLSDAAHPLPHCLVGGKVLCEQREIDEWVRSFAGTTAALDTLVAELLGQARRTPVRKGTASGPPAAAPESPGPGTLPVGSRPVVRREES